MKIDTPKYILAMDCESSGLVSGKKSMNPAYDHKTGERYQAIAWGLVVVDFDTFEPVEVASYKIKFNPAFTWNDRAEKVHGLSREQLEAEGMEEEDFVVAFCELIMKYWGTSVPVIALGHNVTFDIHFIRDQLERHGLAVHFSNRVLDTNTLAMVLANVTGSDSMFQYFDLPPRGSHDPLEDILMTLIAAKGFRDIYNFGVAALEPPATDSR